jgi:HAD superfamily hydrolase (TIGR01509 family)
LKPAALRALIFDVDGTLADTEEMHRQAFNAAFRDARLPWQWDACRYAELLSVTGGKERIASHIASLALPPAESDAIRARIPEIHRDKTRIYSELARAGRLPLRTGVERVMREARAQGLALAIATTTTLENVENLLEAALGREARGWFDVIVAGDEVERKKPFPDAYQAALRRLGLAPHQCVAFEDSAHGLCAALAAGIFTIVTPTAWTADQDFAGAGLVIAGLGDPGLPLDAASAARVGAPMLGLARLQHLLDRSRPQVAAGAPCTTEIS